jgi:hypothetical protein
VSKVARLSKRLSSSILAVSDGSRGKDRPPGDGAVKLVDDGFCDTEVSTLFDKNVEGGGGGSKFDAAPALPGAGCIVN